MKCEQCVSKNLTSRVFYGGSSTTLMHCQPYFDENDDYHHHDTNRTKNYYRCSSGHTWNEIEPLKICFTCGWPNNADKERLDNIYKQQPNDDI